MIEQIADPLAQFDSIALNLSGRVLAEQCSFESCVGVAQTDGTDALLSGCNQQAAQWAINDSIADMCALTSLAVGSRSHAKLSRCLLVQTATRPITCIVKCSSHGFSFLKLLFQ